MKLKMPGGQTVEKELSYGTIERIPLGTGETAEAEIDPKSKFDVGAGYGKKLVKTIHGGVVGIIVDARGRPLELAKSDPERISRLLEWFDALDVYPEREINA